ncbi:MAG TPA: class I SAM-dependent methyltransferase [Candidatus Baltobacteraceae bacterium]|nr:class I SAM-dependent methyltransferase [Candidatus Baltobacteraceae bacterium]
MAALPKKSALRLRVTTAAESMLRGGHPWLFANSVREQNRDGETGELAVIFDRKDRFLAVGLFDSDSPIRVRILHAGKPCAIDSDWWRKRAADAVNRREGLFDSMTTGYRLINGESDGWPGLVLDRYGDTLVLKIYSAAWLPRLEETAGFLAKNTRLVLRLSRNIQKYAAERFGLADGRILRGPPVEGPVLFLENGLRFEADVLRGQKTGFFLDQRDNRRHVGALAEGREVLNLFSYTGGFSLYAADGGAASVLSLDISEHALAGARRNFSLNQARTPVARCRHETIHADAFDWLADKPKKKFGMIVLDPPSLAKRESERAAALGAYGRLIEGALPLLDSNGILVAASCSAHVSADEFFGLARTFEPGIEELKTTRHAADHPATFPESEYLKCIYLRLRG